MKKVFSSLFLVLIVTLYALDCFAEILEMQTFSALSKCILKKVDKDTLVLFDADGVLVEPTEEFSLTFPMRESLYNKVIKGRPKKEIHLMFSDYFRKRKVQPLNKGIYGLLADLESRRIPTTALTGIWTGKYGTIEKMEETRFRDFQQVSLSFSNLTPFRTDRAFLSLKTKDGRIPMVLSGVVFSARGDKGKVLEQAMAAEGINFKRIIFIDDHKDNLESVERLCSRRGIEFLGIHYLERYCIKGPEYNEEREKFRFQVLETEYIWLSDQELDQRLETQ